MWFIDLNPNTDIMVMTFGILGIRLGLSLIIKVHVRLMLWLLKLNSIEHDFDVDPFNSKTTLKQL